MTPRERRAQKRKQEILEAALFVLSEDGYAHASMDKIAERAMLTRVGLYQHFSDKAKLMTALREHKLLELAELSKNAVAQAEGFTAQIRAAVMQTLLYQRQNRGFFHVLLSSSFSSEMSADLSLKPFLYVLAEIFVNGMKSGLVRQGDPLEYAGLTATMIFSPSIKRAFVPVTPDEEPVPEAMAELICGVLFSGVLQNQVVQNGSV